MNHLALIEKTQTLIAAGDIVGAESALVELADAEGDAGKRPIRLSSSTPLATWKAAAKRWLTISPKNGPALSLLPALAPLMPSRIPASYCPYQPCRLRPTSRHGSSKMMFQTATGWSWHGFCVIKTQTCSLKC